MFALALQLQLSIKAYSYTKYKYLYCIVRQGSTSVWCGFGTCGVAIYIIYTRYMIPGTCVRHLVYQLRLLLLLLLL